jgi:TRAP-type C4-dicarboxylate transport system substrate-binding protein
LRVKKKGGTIMKRSVLLVVSLVLIGHTPAIPAPKQTAKYTMRLAWYLPETHRCGRALRYFIDLVESRSKGKFKVDYYPEGKLGRARLNLDQVSAGQIHGSIVITPYFTKYVPWLALADLPFAFPDYMTAWNAYRERIVPAMNKDLAKSKVLVLGIMTSGYRVLLSHKPIRKPGDIAGTKYRVQAAGIAPEYVKCWGGKPLVTPWKEVFTSFEQKVIDLFDLPIASAIDNKFDDIVPHVTVCPLVFTTYNVIVNLDWWNSLPREIQDLVKECFQPAMDFQNLETARFESWGYDYFAKKGANVIHLTPDEIKGFSTLLEPVKTFAVKKYGQDKVNLFLP